MLNLIYCELLKLKRSKMLLLSISGVFATPCMMLAEALQKHFKYPKVTFTLSEVYDNSLLYIMALINLMIFIAITAYLFSREYTENTLKTILTIPIIRTKFIFAKFCILLLWITMLTFVTWLGVYVLFYFYNVFVGLDGFSFIVACQWLIKFIIGSFLMFLTLSPFAFIALKSKGIVAPIIVSAVIVMGSAVLCNQDLGALYPWISVYFLVVRKIESTGYPIPLAIGIIVLVSATGFWYTFHYFKQEDIK